MMGRERWVDVGRLDDIPCRGARRVVAAQGAAPIAVFRTGDDAVFALVDRCPHRSGPLSEGIVEGNAVACPLHGWLIDLASGEAAAPDIGCTPTVPVKLAGDRILLSLASAARWEAA
jgi:nitrite reductase (NADH) small subunit